MEIRRDPETTIDPSQGDLEKAAISHASYGTHDWPEGPTWSVKTTEKGSEYIRDRFE